jgi:hypothetical protein
MGRSGDQRKTTQTATEVNPQLPVGAVDDHRWLMTQLVSTAFMPSAVIDRRYSDRAHPFFAVLAM